MKIRLVLRYANPCESEATLTSDVLPSTSSPLTSSRPTNMNEQNERKCVFCGATAGSREHALPTWLVEAMQATAAPALPFYVGDQAGVELQGNPRATSNLVTKRICNSCNSGWMSDLERQAKSILKDLVLPDRTCFSRSELQQLRQHEPILRRWLVKTAETLSHMASRSGVQQIPPHIAPLVWQNKTPETCLIYAGWLPEAGYNSVVGRGFRAFHNGQFSRNLKNPETFNFIIQLNHLALRISNAPPCKLINTETKEARTLGSQWMLMTSKNADGQSCSPSFISQTTIDMEESDSPVFKDFSEFGKACVVCTGLIPSAFEESEILAAQESLHKRFLP